ncbi:hypothetical protein Lal_00029454 [Lupinus albus]|nr:hypothetical protein Lal_00029454 [Lupinus albus]
MQFDGNANRLEPYSHLQQAFVPMTPNPFVQQYGYIPMQPEPTAPSISIVIGPKQRLRQRVRHVIYVRETNVLRCGVSLVSIHSSHTRYSQSYDSQTMVPSGDKQQGVSSMQFTGSKRQLDEMIGYSHFLNAPDFQCQSSILHEPSTMSSNFTSSQALRTRNEGFSGTWRNEGLTSRDSSSKFPEITRPLRLEGPSRVQLEQAASANELIATERGKGKLPESSTTRYN